MSIYIISGGPCSGKTTVINLLKKKGYKILKEIAGEVIIEELKKEKSKLFPIKTQQNRINLQEEILKRQIQNFSDFDNGNYFTDRFLIDTFTYLELDKIEKEKLNTSLYEKAIFLIESNQTKIVFFMEMLDEKIFDKNEIRREDFKLANKNSKIMIKKYKEFDYEVIIVPNELNSEQRVEFILNKLNLTSSCSSF